MKIVVYLLVVAVMLNAGCNVFPLSETSPTLTVSPAFHVMQTKAVPTPSIESITLTPSPTLSPEESETMIMDLLQNNNGCIFPCWWGLMPSKTEARTALFFFDKFTSLAVAHIFNEYGSYERWLIPKDDLTLDISVSVSYGKQTPNLINSLQVTTQVTRKLDGGSEVAWENPLNEQFFRAYMLPEILSVYGRPQDVLVFANEGWRYFELLLDYSDKGFAIWYSAPLESSGKMFLGCPSKAFTKLYLWTPEFVYTWAEGVTGMGDKSEIEALNRDFRPLQEVTSMTLDEFYSNFTNTENPGCIETPKVIWPGP